MEIGGVWVHRKSGSSRRIIIGDMFGGGAPGFALYFKGKAAGCVVFMYKSGSLKRKQRKKEEQLTRSQRGALDRFFVRERSTISTEDLVDEYDDNDNKELIEDDGLDENHDDDPSPNENDGNADVYSMNHNENGDTEFNEEMFNENLDAVHNDLIEESRLYTRRIHNGETSDRIWLVYYKEIDKAFCFCCKLFKKKPMITQLANEGYNDWSHVGVRHNEHKLRLEKDQTIDKSFEDHIMKEKEHLRKLLRRLISIVKYLAKYNLAFRGKNQRIDKENNRNFMGLVQMVAEHDKVMEEHLRCIQNKQIRYHYLSNVIQNELILMMFSEIRGVTASPVKVNEYFIQFFNVDDTSGLGLFEELQMALTGIYLDIDNVRGQGYDNGSTMNGHKQGVQSRLLDINPRAFYTPCAYHSLNLSLCDITNCNFKAQDFFGVVQRIYSLFANSTKRWKILMDNLIGVTLKPLSTTRWEGGVESVKAIQSQPLQIRQALLQLAENDKDTKPLQIRQALLQLAENDKDTKIRSEAKSLANKHLQEKDISIDVAIELVNGLIVSFRKYRETGFAEAMITTKTLAANLGVNSVFFEKRQIFRKRHFDEVGAQSSELTQQSGEENFRVHYFLLLVDQMIGSLEKRFEQYQTYENIFGFLFRPKKLYAYQNDDLKACCANPTNNLKKESSSDVDGDELFTELLILQNMFPSENMKAINVLNFLKRMNYFPAASIAYKILLTIPVTVASAEHSFSKLKILKSYLRSTMSQERLNRLALLSVESGFLDKIDYEALIDDFAKKKMQGEKFSSEVFDVGHVKIISKMLI
ncbi:zinc finger MYM-type protein 1-like [Asparagus officinalis]|uniref:zinc finger MYM-type protein 1-like n=1 Tax=Asparagus officinalis TaxID=4686 RepID=UPI00098DFD28|nr:zinc finger MYM-type protein 1-like [Asparagus officinalis]